MIVGGNNDNQKFPLSQNLRLWKNLNNSTVCDSFITLSELPLDRFISRKFLLRNPKILDNVQSYLFSFTHIQVSFYLESDREAHENQNELFKSLITI